MLAIYLAIITAMAVLTICYRFAATGHGAPVWIRALPVPKWGDFFIYAGLMASSCFAIYALFMQAMFVPSASMAPGLQPGQTILIKPAAFGPINPFTGSHLTDGDFESLRRGEVVLAKFAYNADVLYIKRVVALPGDVFGLAKEGYSLNGVLHPFEATERENIYRVNLGASSFLVTIDPTVKFEEQAPIKVPQGFVYMLGDNLTKSSDSRELGFISLRNIIARPL